MKQNCSECRWFSKSPLFIRHGVCRFEQKEVYDTKKNKFISVFPVVRKYYFCIKFSNKNNDILTGVSTNEKGI